MDWSYYDFVKLAFGQAYRIDKKDWAKLMKGNFYNPVRITHKLDGGKILFVHAKDDKVVMFGPVKKFATTVGAKLISYNRGGHFGASGLLKTSLSKQVFKFLRSELKKR